MSNFLRDVKRNWKMLMLTLPCVIYIIMFQYIPKFGVILAFKDFNYRKGIFGSEWNGFENFRFLFESGQFGILMRNTLAYSLTFLITGVVLNVFLAILFDALGGSKLNRINQTVVILPHFLSIMVIANFAYMFLAEDKGMINNLLIKIGVDSVNWFSEPKYWPFILFIINAWMTTGWGSVLYYATIKGFDRSCYEAATIDGATWWQTVKYLTLPLLKPTIIIMFINSIGGILATGSGLYYYIPRNSGPLFDATTTIDTYVFRNLVNGGNYGQTSAVSVFQSVVGCILVLTTNQIVKKVSPGDELF